MKRKAVILAVSIASIALPMLTSAQPASAAPPDVVGTCENASNWINNAISHIPCKLAAAACTASGGEAVAVGGPKETNVLCFR